MSSSKKKQLRKEQYMTERQTASAKEAKALKRYTITFWVVILVVASIFIGAVVANPLKNMTVANAKALQVGDYTLSAAELNYYYIDTINEYIQTYSSYLSLLMDTSKPLNQQVVNMDTGATWADNFLESAKENIKSVYAVYDAAMKDGFQLSESGKTSINSTMAMAELYAAYYGYNNVTGYLRAMYGNGASEKSYRKYLEVSAIASEYLNQHSASLEYSAEDLVNYQASAPYKFNSYTFSYYYVSSASFRTGGTTDEKGNVTYNDMEKLAAEKAAKEAADKLAAGNYADVDDFDYAIMSMEVNAENTTAAAVRNEAVLYSNLPTLMQDWLIGKVASEDANAEPTFEVRNEGDMTVITNSTTSGETVTVNGYYVVRFGSVETNEFLMKDVRHVLISFEGGTTDSTTGTTTFSDAEKLVAKEKAEQLLSDWVAAGDVSEESFAELAKKNSKDGNAAQGGLYEDVYPGQMVASFEDWIYDADRKVGDYGIVETQYGYHIMFFVGDAETTFRDYMITNTVRNEDVMNWQNDLISKLTVEVLTIKHVAMDITLG